MKYLVTGGCGFLGSNLASEILKRGEDLFIFDNFFRPGTEKNFEWLKTKGKFVFLRGDIRNFYDIETAVKLSKPDVIFHVAGQVAMTTSLEHPRIDFETNSLGTFNLLESVKNHSLDSIVVYSSTNKVYGDLENLNYNESDSRYSLVDYPNGIPESIPLDFRTPYGCSKGSADQYIKDAFRCFGIKTIVFRHSSIYGSRQFSSSEQGWIGWFVKKALESKKNINQESFSISGTGKQVRDVLYSEDLISCYFNAIQNIKKTQGEVYNIGGGPDNSLSLLELFEILENFLNTKLYYSKLSPRTSDQKVFIADISKAKKHFNWSPKVNKLNGLKNMIEWIKNT